MGRNNAPALLPQYTHQGPLTHGPFTCQPPATWPHLGVRVDLRGLYHAFAPPVRHLRAAWACAALPRGLACRVASARVPRATSALRVTCPLRVLRKINPFFAIFIEEKSKINSKKIQKNVKYSEIYIFKIITPFNLKFSPLDHNFLSF